MKNMKANEYNINYDDDEWYAISFVIMHFVKKLIQDYHLWIYRIFHKNKTRS